MKFENYFTNKKILVCGGTGTIGSEIVAQLLKCKPKAVRILSNSENELWESKQKFNENTERLRFLLGDIRSYERIKRATNDVDIIFNAAAVKHVPISEYNPMEAIKVNIHGLPLQCTVKQCLVRRLPRIFQKKQNNLRLLETLPEECR